MKAVARNDHSLKCLNSVLQIAPYIDLLMRLGAILILKSLLAKQLLQFVKLILLPLLCFRCNYWSHFASCCSSFLR